MRVTNKESLSKSGVCLRKFPQEARFQLDTKGSIEVGWGGIEAEIGQSLESRDRKGWEKMLCIRE